MEILLDVLVVAGLVDAVPRDSFERVLALHAHIDLEGAYPDVFRLEASARAAVVDDVFLRDACQQVGTVTWQALLADGRVDVSRVESVQKLASLLKLWAVADAHFLKNAVIQLHKLFGVFNHIEVIIEFAICLVKDVKDQTLEALGDAVVVAVAVEVIARVEELLDFEVL